MPLSSKLTGNLDVTPRRDDFVGSSRGGGVTGAGPGVNAGAGVGCTGGVTGGGFDNLSRSGATEDVQPPSDRGSDVFRLPRNWHA